MTLTVFGGAIQFPPVPLSVDSSLTLDAEGEKAAAIFRIPKTGTLKKIYFGCYSVTTADTITVRIETVDDTTGHPTGTLYATDATGTKESPSGSGKYYVPINGSAGISVTAGDLVAVVFSLDYVDGNLKILSSAALYGISHAFPYGCLYTASWAKSTTIPAVGLEYDGEAVYTDGLPVPSGPMISGAPGASALFNGNKFALPFGARCVGAWANMDADVAIAIKLFSSDGVTELASVDIDPDVRQSTGQGIFNIMFPSAVTLAANTFYRIILAFSSNSGVHYTHVFVDDGTILGIHFMPMGANCYRTVTDGTPTQEADWTDTTTNRSRCGILVDAIDIPAGSSTKVYPRRVDGLIGR